SFFRVEKPAVERGERLFARYGSLTIFFARFVFGMRIIAGPLAGVLKMPWKKFFLFNFLGAVLWVTVVASLGYFFGSRWDWLMTELEDLQLVLAGVAVLALLVSWWRERKRAARAG